MKSARKLRSLNNKSLKNLLCDMEDSNIDDIAHADRDDLVEGLDFIEK
jgi:hypothetical protein